MAKIKANTIKKNATNILPPKQGPVELSGEFLTNNQGLRLSDNHNSLKAGIRGPSLLEDFVLREKITSFDHERIPERVVHARGAGAFGQFVCTKNMSQFTEASFLSSVGKITPVFTRFSTVAGSRGSADTVRDVRGFSVKFYTEQGNYDLVGNNIPVFFIQDAMKFPDLIHSVKPEPHHEIPQASSAHDTFWDFISLMPESTHMIFWHLSDRAIPRSFRMMEGFGVHTFRFVNEKGLGTFVKFHWKPRLGVHSLVWEEAQLLAGQDPDFHRRDLFETIEAGSFPEWDLGVQLIPEADEHKFPFDLLDPTKLVPEELVPVTLIGTLTLNRNPDNFFSEVEQAVFHPGHLVPGIDLTNDPLLQGRLFSYTDTQLTRLGGPNFHELPVNRPLAPINNHQRDGFMRQAIPKGRVAYEPNSLGGGCPFLAQMAERPFVSYPERIEGHLVRARSESFGDHFSQAKLFYNSQTKPEKNHIRDAFIFELSKVETLAIRERMVQTLLFVDAPLANEIAQALNLDLPKKPVEFPSAANPENNIVPENPSRTMGEKDDARKSGKKVALPTGSAPLSMVASLVEGCETRKVGVLISKRSLYSEITTAKNFFEKSGMVVELVGPGVGKISVAGGEVHCNHAIASTPSVVYDGVYCLCPMDSFAKADELGKALKFIGQAFKHCKTIGASGQGQSLLERATFDLAKSPDNDASSGVVVATAQKNAKSNLPEFVAQLSKHRHWAREDAVKALPF